jgi:hypothetical protein
LDSKERIKDITPILKHLLQYTYRASVHEVINEQELKKINASLEKIEKLIRKILKEEEPTAPESAPAGPG